MIGIALGQQHGVRVVVVVVGHIDMQPLSVHIDEIPCMISGADGYTRDIRSTAEEFERLSVGAAGGLQFSGMWGECPRNSSGGFSVIGQKCAEVAIEVLHFFTL